MGITHSLKHDHRVIEQCLRGLEGICARLERTERVPPETLMNTYEFIEAYAERYHRGKEETHLIPALIREGIVGVEGGIEAALREHAAEVEVLRALGRAIRAYSRGNPDAADEVILHGRTYAAILVGHFQKEDTLLFRLVDELLPAEACGALANAFQRAEDELGQGGCARYEAMARELEATWGI